MTDAARCRRHAPLLCPALSARRVSWLLRVVSHPMTRRCQTPFVRGPARLPGRSVGRFPTQCWTVGRDFFSWKTATLHCTGSRQRCRAVAIVRRQGRDPKSHHAVACAFPGLCRALHGELTGPSCTSVSVASGRPGFRRTLVDASMTLRLSRQCVRGARNPRSSASCLSRRHVPPSHGCRSRSPGIRC